MTNPLIRFFTKNTAEYWDKAYRAELATGKIRADKNLSKTLFLFHKAKSILDFGAGAGGNVKFLASQFSDRSFCLVDHSTTSLAYARDKLLGDSDSKGNRFEFHTSLDSLKTRSFDLVMSIEVIEHVKNYKDTLDSLWSLVSPGGMLLISVPVKGWRDRNREHVNKFTIKQIFELLRSYSDWVHVSARTFSKRSGVLSTAYFYIEKPLESPTAGQRFL